MKNILILFFCLSSLCTMAQDEGVPTSVLLLERNNSSDPEVKIIRPYREISIVTKSGQELTFPEYSLIGDSAVTSFNETIALNDIAAIKGYVAGDFWRKLGGGTLIVGGLSFASVAIGAAAAGFYPYLLVAVPALGVFYLGSRVAGARYFDVVQKWTLRIVPLSELE